MLEFEINEDVIYSILKYKYNCSSTIAKFKKDSFFDFFKFKRYNQIATRYYAIDKFKRICSSSNRIYQAFNGGLDTLNCA